jgi:hypothetical protein
MKNYLSVLLLVGTCVLFSCKKESAPTASATTTDPFIRYDNAASDIDHQIFQLYTQTGIPVLYSDTVAKNPLFKLNIGYHLTSVDSLAGLNFITSQILPGLSSNLKPYSILMVDSVFSYKINYPNIRVKQPPLSTYLAYNSLVIGKITTIKNMIPDSVKTYKRDIFKSIATVQLNQHPELLTAFYAVSAAYYGKYAYSTAFTTFYVPLAPEETYGILAPNGITPPYGYTVPTQSADLDMYLYLTFLYSSAEFSTRYSSYPLVMSKYAVLIKALTTVGFKL